MVRDFLKDRTDYSNIKGMNEIFPFIKCAVMNHAIQNNDRRDTGLLLLIFFTNTSKI
jgi:hypothetical protein